MSLQSALGRARGHGSAHHGVDHWKAQRLTAIANGLLVVWFVFNAVPLLADGRAAVLDWLSHPVPAAAAALMFASIFYHASLGLQIVIEDYLHAPWTKWTALIASKLLCAGFGGVAVVSATCAASAAFSASVGTR